MTSSVKDGHRYYRPHIQLGRPFGDDWFGRKAEAFARNFGTPVFLIAQTVLVAVWIAANVLMTAYKWDPYPFILLNLAFSTQAAYAAPLILLSQTREADREKALAIAAAEHHEAIARKTLAREDAAAAQTKQIRTLLESNTVLTAEVARLARELHRHALGAGNGDRPVRTES
jgi:uncharacterized membrane protein